MPYLSKEKKDQLLLGKHPETSGELNFLLTQTVQKYLRQKGLSYESLNAAIGALEAAKIEFYRRLVGPYEDTKKEQNGDVYEGHWYC